MLAHIKKTALATAIIATAVTGFSSVATAAERSELTIHLKSSTPLYATSTHSWYNLLAHNNRLPIRAACCL
ncbi:(GlcNAc)2 ABC transporter periplasmic substrate-binding protein [Vibrio maritimus]|uniref:(GlcNAc)2 ABC transporter periplasmic substrate-binding protein n=1 Tax=Vibrio maritimus TaxID=990268 RepID=A0A090T0A8_9VIBR|nr:(GlcNAc)2 ABC transporter periplasmic substrate-binding protein [Vibrio maritimus]